MPTKAELVETLGKGKTKAEIADLEAMSKADLEALSGDEESEAPEGPGTTVPGGRYKVGGKIVNSEGEDPDKKAKSA